MQGKKFSLGLGMILAIFTVAVLATTSLAATEKVLHYFGGGNDGLHPAASMILDAAGNLYGTTFDGGDSPCYPQNQGCGTVFELTPKEGGGWTEKVLHNFGHGMDGTYPYTDLIWDSAGNLYGTTYGGGDDRRCDEGCGTVFELTPQERGGWTEKVIHNFGHGMDGSLPQAGLIWDAAGNLYGTTTYGGDHNGGTAFEMTPKEGGGWTEKVLHNFWSRPYTGLTIDRAGNLYGVINWAGDTGFGVVFELTPNDSGGWTEKALHYFGIYGKDGIGPSGALIWDAAGNLYGLTSGGGTFGAGTVFEMTPKEGGGWTEKVLHSFGFPYDGAGPHGKLIWDAAGNLYGTTYSGGNNPCYPSGMGCGGTVFKLTPKEGGGWTEKVLHNLGHGTDGAYPSSGLIIDAVGNLYGTTMYGGDHPYGRDASAGVVFEVTP